MNISFDYYRTFYFVAKYKKISLAAEKLYVSQPAVTQVIQKLEEQLDTSLFIRSKKGLELTETGIKLYDFVKSSIETLENAESNVDKYKNLEEGIIKIRTGSNIAKILLYDALEKFGKKYPNIKIEIATGPANKSVEMVHTGEIDMALVYLPYNLEYNNLELIECLNEEYVFAMSKKYYEKKKVKISKIEDLNKYDLIIPKKNSAIRNIYDEKFKNIITSFHYEIAQEQMKKEFIMRDMGIGFIMKDEIKNEIKSGKVILVNKSNAICKGGIGIIKLKKEISSFATEKLVEYINLK